MLTAENQRPVGCIRSTLVDAAQRVSLRAAERAGVQDRHGGFPQDDIASLNEAGLLAAVIPSADGGAGLGEEAGQALLRDVLTLVGRGSLALGRLYEGHVNALQLIARLGSNDQRRRFFGDAEQGHLFGTWNTEPLEDSLVYDEYLATLRLDGCKILASGAGFVTRSLVTARPRGSSAENTPSLMLVVDLETNARADLSGWRAQGMRGSASGQVSFSDLEIARTAILGEPGDYQRQPFFSGGAWRFTAVQLGGIEAVFDAWKSHLRATNRGQDPHQLARLGEGAIALQTARLWVESAAKITSDALNAADDIVASVNLARLAVERAGLEVLTLAQRSVGLAGFLEVHPLERLGRDLATYLRQPGPDRALTSAAAHLLSRAGERP